MTWLHGAGVAFVLASHPAHIKYINSRSHTQTSTHGDRRLWWLKECDKNLPGVYCEKNAPQRRERKQSHRPYPDRKKTTPDKLIQIETVAMARAGSLRKKHTKKKWSISFLMVCVFSLFFFLTHTHACTHSAAHPPCVFFIWKHFLKLIKCIFPKHWLHRSNWPHKFEYDYFLFSVI